MAKKKKYYVVWQGHDTGIFDSWSECQQKIKNYPGAKYKSFASKEEAEAAFHGNFRDHIGATAKKTATRARPETHPEVDWDSWSVDAACSGNPGIMEYRGVETRSGGELFRIGPFKNGTNNIGEFLAIVHALALLQRMEATKKPIYTDSRTALAWIRNKKAKTQLKRTATNEKLFELIARAEKWLKENTFANPLIKWNTEEWGEIPADFGRK
jgi:ribonuclease HI